ncbi:MAG: DMT family transporter [Thermoanaerobaculum sp.]|nr:DMT family transporter [Thermoanaerobaculum sp.]MDW7968643.1 DMT family transporter [Thermoanaerobaculum sp.]
MRQRVMLALAAAVLAISWGAPLARMTQAAPLAVAAWRLTLASMMLTPLVLWRFWPLPKALLHGLWAGLFLALHFGLWIPSLFLTSVSASVVLVTTQPLWVLLLQGRVLGRPVTFRNFVSFTLAFGGVVVIAWGDLQLSLRALVGDLMALGGAVAMAGYLLVGTKLRARVPLAAYLWVVNGAGALLLWVALCLGKVSPQPANTLSWLTLLGMALGPTLIGHTLLNWALAHLPTYQVNLTVLLEPALASLWVWVFLGEAPPLHVVPGAVLVLAALVLEYWPTGGVSGSR